MFKTILERLKSPVVISQLVVSVFAVAAVLTGENYDNLVVQITTMITALFAIFSAMNNPTNRDNF